MATALTGSTLQLEVRGQSKSLRGARIIQTPKGLTPLPPLPSEVKKVKLAKSSLLGNSLRTLQVHRGRSTGTVKCQASNEDKEGYLEKYQQQKKRSEAKVIAIDLNSESNPYFNSFLTTFGYGVAAGLLCESARSLFELLSLAGTLGWHTLVSSLPALREVFQPEIYLDHFVGIVFWSGLYCSQALAIGATIQQKDAAREALEAGKAEDELARRAATPLAFRDSDLDGPLPGIPTLAPLPPDLNTAPAPPPTLRPKDSPDFKKKDRSNLKPGEWNPTSFLPGHDKRMADRKAYLKNFWYAAALAEDVKSEPHGVKLLDMDIALYRGADGVVHAVSDVCPHRGAPLSMGWTTTHDKKACIVCPYHGWIFDDSGVLRDVPANSGNESLPKTPILDVFSATERGGFIWLFYGDPKLPADERPPIPIVPEVEDPSWTTVYGEFEFEAPYMDVFENALDVAHIHFLHNDSFGNDETPEVMQMNVTPREWGVYGTMTMKNKPPSQMWEFARTPQVDIQAEAMLPCSSAISFELGAGIKMVTYVSTVPIDGNRTINRYALARNFLAGDLPGTKEYVRKSMTKIFSEDEEMVTRLKPEAIRREMNVNADQLQLVYRKLRQEFVDLGFGVMPRGARKPCGGDGVDGGSGSMGDM
mmetsp:Transcript_32024/g.38775  ORF Transcript_32024/g.38775 Transcript_32024/m.38775 type:complete len:645 (+) Transcript_32024:157-2091(+)|eukprot:CAMPEP_0197847828 /NCGR_PEP_ID=MMETSP1438-20131217/7215_1 /TAXON_ID=1461541 /ORGANISM="Pterosperma sp., Strain CCMP1384" /LENGTH=644 /DNA_ID=CAMNT_0043459865 /DNA_START=150 /DNA_END=2084 /DNA_ORIENTATION=+